MAFQQMISDRQLQTGVRGLKEVKEAVERRLKRLRREE